MTDKQIFKVSDMETAVVELLKTRSSDDYTVIVQGVRVMIAEHEVTLSIYVPFQGMHRLKGTKALDWIAEACREKLEREAAHE